MSANCALCADAGGETLWQDDFLRVVRVDDPEHPGFLRVILQAHVPEMTDLDADDRIRLMTAVWTVEAVLREVLQPDKINLASFGNVVPHLHWHVIPRWRRDRHFPDPIWAPARRPEGPAVLDADGHALDPVLLRRGKDLQRRLVEALDGALAPFH